MPEVLLHDNTKRTPSVTVLPPPLPSLFFTSLGTFCFHGPLGDQCLSEVDRLCNGEDGCVSHCAPAARPVGVAARIRLQQLGTIGGPHICLAEIGKQDKEVVPFRWRERSKTQFWFWCCKRFVSRADPLPAGCVFTEPNEAREPLHPGFSFDLSFSLVHRCIFQENKCRCNRSTQ